MRLQETIRQPVGREAHAQGCLTSELVLEDRGYLPAGVLVARMPGAQQPCHFGCTRFQNGPQAESFDKMNR